MHHFTRHIPNTLTLLNLFSGCCALVFTFHNQPVQAAWCTAACFLLDYADGLAARALRATGPLGKELDSLADMVSFGVLPAAMLYAMLTQVQAMPREVAPTALPVFVLSAFSGLRLAKFNLDTRQTHYFLGLSTPAATLFVLGWRLSEHFNLYGLAAFLRQPWLIYSICALLCALLVSEIPMFGMKIKFRDFKSNLLNLIGLILAILLFFFFQYLGLSLVIVFYIVFSILFRKKVVGGGALSA